MGVERFRDVSDMPSPPRARADELPRRIRDVWKRAVTMAGFVPARGVQRFASVADAQDARLEESRHRAQAHQGSTGQLAGGAPQAS